MTKFLNISTDTTLGGSSASDEVVSSQKALKTYIDNNDVTYTAGDGIDIKNNTISLDKIFWVTYGTTTYSDIMTAWNAGKIIMMSYTPSGTDSILFLCERLYWSRFCFNTVTGNTQIYNVTLDWNNNWYLSATLLQPQIPAGTAGNVITYTGTAGSVGSAVLPTVNDSTITIQKNGTTVDSFTTNASSAKTINITVPTNNNQLTNGAGYITGITSTDVTTALGYTPYNSSNPNGYTSNVGTVTSVNSTSPDGSGNVSISVGDTLPSQSGQSGKFLTTDGSSTSWASVGGSSLPSQTGHSGEFLTTDGTDASWASVDALPSQTGQSGKYLTTDGSSASWSSVTVPVKDNLSITENSSNQLQTVGVIDQANSSRAIKTWTGTKAQYDLIVSKDANTVYNITDDTTSLTNVYTKAEVDALLANKIQQVASLPASPVAGVLYLIPE